MLTTEGGLSAEAAKFHAWDTLLEYTRPDGKFREIEIGTNSRRLVSCCLMKVAFHGTRDYCTQHKRAEAEPAGTEVAILAFRETL